ncbi:MAG TPA: LuxR C-terminal-related transcriptional regulator, partial [Dehalococcoidia bacterium]|nr:LuxR C-terminal-related transcriptional regulator [Dehalococcoidia bacterium]
MSLRRRGRLRHPDVLTPAEWRVVEGVRHGMTNREIARGQGVSLDAVKFHVENAVAKLGLEGRRALRFWRGVRRDSALAR